MSSANNIYLNACNMRIKKRYLLAGVKQVGDFRLCFFLQLFLYIWIEITLIFGRPTYRRRWRLEYQSQKGRTLPCTQRHLQSWNKDQKILCSMQVINSKKINISSIDVQYATFCYQKCRRLLFVKRRFSFKGN